MNLLKRTPNYSTRPWVEYQYFRWILWMFVESSQVKPNYLWFWPFMGHSQIITRLWCILYKLLLPDSSKNSTFVLKKARLITQYSTWGWVTRPRSINFTFWLQLNLGHRLLVFASTTNLELGPRFADICWKTVWILNHFVQFLDTFIIRKSV